MGIWAALNLAAAVGLWSEKTRCASPPFAHGSILGCHLYGCMHPCTASGAGKHPPHQACCVLRRVGKELSSPLVATLVGLLFSNLGIIGGPKAAGVYSVVNSFILPLAIPLLLFSADLR